MSDENGGETETAVMGMKAGQDWALYGPFLDKTLIRNYMWMNIAGQIMPDWTPQVRFCELILNGEYQGLYVMMEMIEVQKNRLNLTEYEDGDLIPSYLVRIEPKTNPDRELENFSFYSYRMEEGKTFELLYPGLSHQNEHVLNYVETDLSEIERKIYAAEVTSGTHEWKNVLDMESFINYYILEEFAGIIDTFSASTYFYKDTRGKLKIGPVWDFNNASDNFFQPVAYDTFIVANRGWFGQLMHDQEFVTGIVKRYRQLRKTVLSDEYLINYVQETESWLGSAIDRNWKVWGYSFDTSVLDPHERRSAAEGNSDNLEAYNPVDYQQANEWMLNYMLQRAHWLDDNIDTLYQYAHQSKYNGKTID